MKNNITELLRKLNNLESIPEIDKILDELVPLLKAERVSTSEILTILKLGDSGFGIKSQDHRGTITNSHKAKLVIERLMKKMKE